MKASPDSSRRPRPPNVVIIVADDHRHDCLHAAGHPIVRTPNLDQLARDGTRFTRTQAMGGNNRAVCVPSRAALLTGCCPPHAVAFDPGPPSSRWATTIEPGVPLLGEQFRQAGYSTFISGKWHNCRASLNRSFAAGSRIFIGGMCRHTAVPVFDYDPSGAYAPENARVEDGFSSEIFADGAIEFLRGHDSPAPFFLYLAFISPHDPRTPPEAYRRLYRDDDIPLLENSLPEHPFDNGELSVRDEKLAARPRQPAEIRRHLADYYGMISHQDAQIGRVVEVLRQQGRLDSTIVVYLSDHGLAMGQHGLMGKQNLYEHSTRVPLILSGPGVPADRRVEAPVYSFDLMPTLCDLCGIATPSGIDGRSLAPWLAANLSSAEATRRETLFAFYRDCQRSVHDGRWKLIEYRVDGRVRRQLFDLENDPCESLDLAATEIGADHLSRLEVALENWERQLGLKPTLVT